MKQNVKKILLIVAICGVSLGAVGYKVLGSESKTPRPSGFPVTFNYQDFSTIALDYSDGKLNSITQRHAKSDGTMVVLTKNLNTCAESGFLVRDGKLHSGAIKDTPISIGQKLPKEAMAASHWEANTGFVRHDTHLGVPVFVIINRETGREDWINPSFGVQPLKTVRAVAGKIVSSEVVSITLGPQDESRFALPFVLERK